MGLVTSVNMDSCVLFVLCLCCLVHFANSLEIRVKTGAAALFYLPPYSECGKYSLYDRNDHAVVSVDDNAHAHVDSQYESRAYQEVLGNGTVKLALYNVTSRDTGTFLIKQDGGYNCNDDYFFSLTLLDGSHSWLGWSEWSACSVTCGRNGVRERHRRCTRLGQCDGDHRGRKSCTYRDSCPRHVAYWSDWNPWTRCSATCGQGIKQRTRTCSEKPESLCSGSFLDKDNCSDRACSSASVWTSWSAWNRCSQTCGGGTRPRYRQCRSLHSDATGACKGLDTDTSACSPISCPPTGRTFNQTPRYVWSTWSEWTRCHKTCGAEVRHRHRKCMTNDDTRRELPREYCGSGLESEEDSCRHAACSTHNGQGVGSHVGKPGVSNGSGNMGQSNDSKDIGITVPLSGIVGTVAVIFILVLLVIVIVLVTRLRKKNRSRANDVTSEAVQRQDEGNRKPKTTHKKVVSICEESDSHCYAEIDDIIMKTQKSKSIVTIDNPYSELPKSASPSSKVPNENRAGARYAHASNEERVFLFGNQTGGHNGNGTHNDRLAVPGTSRSGYQSSWDCTDGGYLTPQSSEEQLEERQPRRYVKTKTK